jgi:hypothetical protein
MAPGPAGLSPGFQLLADRRISLLSTVLHLRPGEATPASVRAALDKGLEHVRLPDLPDDLNPIVLDPVRVEAFIEGLPRQPVDVLARLEGRFLVLGAEGLWLSLSSPLEAAAIAAGYELKLPDEDGNVVQPELRGVMVRQAFAEGIAARAEAALHTFEAEVRALEAAGTASNALSQAKWRRFAVATVWRLATKALAEVAPRFRRAHEDAVDAVGRYVVPPWVGMPPR